MQQVGLTEVRPVLLLEVTAAVRDALPGVPVVALPVKVAPVEVVPRPALALRPA